MRGLNPGVPARTARQLPQLQFHCGKPPPAPDPKTLIRIGFSDMADAPRHRSSLTSFSLHYAQAGGVRASATELRAFMK
jgi:hypothetical protein